MKNYISLNIKYLYEQNFLSQDEFGELFGLNKSVIGTYVREKSMPKIDVIQKICTYYKISIDDFVNNSLAEIGNVVQEPKPNYGRENEMLLLKDEIISLQKNEIERLKEKIDSLSKASNSKTA